MKSDHSSVTIPSELFELLLEEMQPGTDHILYDYLSIDPEEQRKIYPAYEIAEKAAKEKQRALSATGPGKITLKLGVALTIHGLNESAVDACVAAFSKNLKIVISNNTRKVLCLWAHRRLKRDFSETFTVELQKKVAVKSPDGQESFLMPASTVAMRHTPPHLKDYYLGIQPLADGKPAGRLMFVFPSQIKEGQRYDFLTIETTEEAAKAAADKPGEAPGKEKGR